MFALLVIVAFLVPVPSQADAPGFADSFGRGEERAMLSLLREIDDEAADTFRRLRGSRRAAFVSRFWDRICPTFSRTYVDFQLGNRHLNVSPSFYNDADFLPTDYWIHSPTPDPHELNRAVKLCEKLLEQNRADGVASIALGYCLLDLDRHIEAEEAFTTARKFLRKEPAIYNGLGLAWVKRPKRQTVARDWFRDALALDRSYAAASYNLAMSQIATNVTDVPFHIGKVIWAFPAHPDAYYKLGVWHDIRSRFDGEFIEEAAKAYQDQIEVNPEHYAAWSNLARMWMRDGKYDEAVRICVRVMEEAPPYRVRVLPVLMEAYQALGRIREADEAAERFVEMLDARTREHFRDVSLIASREEKTMLDSLSGDEREAFVDDFWIRHDPSPGTPENEKRVEHVRRVGHAMVMYSDGAYPWDTRGDVYVRYGEPQHKSKSSNMRFETAPDVVRVRDRLLSTLSDEERNQIRQSHRRIRTSTRDVEKEVNEDGSYRIEVSDFEPAEFGMDPAAGDNRHGNPDPNERSYQRGLIESINDRIAPVDIRGVPLFPVEGNLPWEYWIYTDVGPGIEVVFAAPNLGGGFGFAEPPVSGRKVAQFTERTFELRRPANVIARAIERQPSLLRLRVAPMSFAYDSADYRAEDGLTSLEVQVGRAKASTDTVRTDVDVLLYDKGWNAVDTFRTRIEQTVAAGADTSMAVTAKVVAAPGQYILALQLEDPVTREMGSQQVGVEIESYPDSALALSDLSFASAVIPDDGVPRGFRVEPNPWRTYLQSDPVVVFYEIYGLVRNDFGQTRYRMDYRITPLDGGALVARIVRGIGRPLGIDGRESLTISFEQVGEDADESSYVEIDVSGSAAGEYALSLVVTDLTSGQSTAKSHAFRIVEASAGSVSAP